MKFRFGIEHEVALLNSRNEFVDWTNTTFEQLENIVAGLPLYPADYPQLRIGDAGIKHKRWYVEGYERFDSKGKVIDCPPKGIEIRTTIHDSIGGAFALSHRTLGGVSMLVSGNAIIRKYLVL